MLLWLCFWVHVFFFRNLVSFNSVLKQNQFAYDLITNSLIYFLLVFDFVHFGHIFLSLDFYSDIHRNFVKTWKNALNTQKPSIWYATWFQDMQDAIETLVFRYDEPDTRQSEKMLIFEYWTQNFITINSFVTFIICNIY